MLPTRPSLSRGYARSRPTGHNRCFCDPLSRKLAGEYRKKALATRALTIVAWSVAIRTVIIDDLIDCRRSPKRSTLSSMLGAGLDTRPYRMELPPSLRWVEVDFPAVIDLRINSLLMISRIVGSNGSSLI